jgi:site-specific recombinase XerD
MAGSARSVKPVEEGGTATSIERAIVLFQEHINAHSPTKLATLRRYNQVLDHFARILGNKKYVEAVTRSGIEDYKIARSRETVGNDRRPVSAATINFEITVLRTLFYYLIRERCISMDNPCTRFKPLRSDKERLKRRPPVYGQAELDKIIAESGHIERAIFATLVLTGLRKDELCDLPPENCTSVNESSPRV